MSYSKETLESVREAVARVKSVDLSEAKPDDELELDSIGRITLIAELENAFAVEISDMDVTPELFESLGSLASLMERLRP